MLSHGFSPCAGQRVSCCGPYSVSSGCFRISICPYAGSAHSDCLRQCVARSSLVAFHRRRDAVPPSLFGLALAADAALLTGLLDITGGPFNPFIVMYAAYIWVAAVAVSPAMGRCRGCGVSRRFRLACRRSPAGGLERAPSAERLSRRICSRCGSPGPALRSSSRTTWSERGWSSHNDRHSSKRRVSVRSGASAWRHSPRSRRGRPTSCRPRSRRSRSPRASSSGMPRVSPNQWQLARLSRTTRA